MSRGIRLIVAIAVGVATGVVGQATAEADTYSQFGAGNAQSGQTTGVRSTVTQPQAQSDGYWRWYWPGVTLNNGDFLQGGYADPSGPSCGLQWFYWSFNSAGTPVQQLYGPCGLTGSHEFRIVKEGTSGAYYNFVFRIDGVQSASTLSAASWAYTNQIGIVTELFSSGTFTTTPFVPTVTYSPALQFYNCVGACGWGNASTVRVYRGYVSPCPTAYVVKSTTYAARTYASTAGGTCLANGTGLW
jgi:hypothetical protein